MYDLLSDEILSVRIGSNPKRKLTLPDYLHVLGTQTEVVLVNAQAWQVVPIHQTACLLAASILDRTKQNSAAQSPAFWRDNLLGLTHGSEEAWHLFVDDFSQPAFGQPPCAGADVSELWKTCPTPQYLDRLLATKEYPHGSVMFHPDPEHWAFAMISGHWGAVRQNHHYERSGRQIPGGRVHVGVLPDLDWARAFRRDVVGLLKEKTVLGKKYLPNGEVIPWLRQMVPYQVVCSKCDLSFQVKKLPTTSCPSCETDMRLKLQTWTYEELSPFHLDFGRLFRLVESNAGDLVAIQHKNFEPLIHLDTREKPDFWSPCGERDKVLGVGLNPETLHKILFEKGRISSLQAGDEEDAELPVLVEGVPLDSNESTSLGFHSHVVRIPSSWCIQYRRDLAKLAAQSETMLKEAAAVRRVLSKALDVIQQRGLNTYDTYYHRQYLLQFLEGQDSAGVWKDQLAQLASDIYLKAEKRVALSSRTEKGTPRSIEARKLMAEIHDYTHGPVKTASGIPEEDLQRLFGDLAYRLRRLEKARDLGTLAGLRRLDPDKVPSSGLVYTEVLPKLFDAGIEDTNEVKAALTVFGWMACDPGSHGWKPLGRALQTIDFGSRPLDRMVSSKGGSLRHYLDSAMARLRSKRGRVNYTEAFLLMTTHGEDAQAIRRRISSDFYTGN